MTLRFFCWNINRNRSQAFRQLLGAVGTMADVVVLIENDVAPEATARELGNFKAITDAGRDEDYSTTENKIPPPQLYIRNGLGLIATDAGTPILNDRLRMHALQNTKNEELLISTVHLPSKKNATTESQGVDAGEMATHIKNEELKSSYFNMVGSLVLGDFNMNPYEHPMLLVEKLNAKPDLEYVKALTRGRREFKYPYFYNPMWGFLGELEKLTGKASPARGTYYYKPGTNDVVPVGYWNMYDGVLLRPSIADRLNHSTLRIVHQIGNTTLLVDGTIDTTWSDHLPIAFDFNF